MAHGISTGQDLSALRGDTLKDLLQWAGEDGNSENRSRSSAGNSA
jgi:hypothetical protein